MRSEVALRRLTPRQYEVLAKIEVGKSNKEIARGLGIAESTVKIHVAGLLRAMRVRNRTEAAARAADYRTAGIIVSPWGEHFERIKAG